MGCHVLITIWICTIITIVCTEAWIVISKPSWFTIWTNSDAWSGKKLFCRCGLLPSWFTTHPQTKIVIHDVSDLRDWSYDFSILLGSRKTRFDGANNDWCRLCVLPIELIQFNASMRSLVEQKNCGTFSPGDKKMRCCSIVTFCYGRHVHQFLYKDVFSRSTTLD